MSEAINHSERKHALLSASGASRWINCTPSPRLEEQFEEPESSDFAEEGTLAHEFGDLSLRKIIGLLDEDSYAKQTDLLRAHKMYTDEMEGEVEKYTTYVLEELSAARQITKDALLYIETKVNLTEYIEAGFGTCDAIIIADGVMEVIDLKYGKGVRVSAKDNSQLKLYGLGALRDMEHIYDIETVRLTICQPRLDAISSWDISAKDLKTWGEEVVKPRAEMAFKGEGEQCAGDWCKWCKAKVRCRALAEQNLALARLDFADPALLDDTELLNAYALMPRLQDWVNAVSDYLLKSALDGKQWEGLKLVEGRSVRSWSDQDKAIEVLKGLGHKDEAILNVKLKGIGDIEKVVGKKEFPIVLGSYVVKPQGKPTLVDASDKRQAIGLDTAKEDFKD